MEHSIAEFERGLRALAPENQPPRHGRRTSKRRRVLARDLAIDLGTANTLVYARGHGIILNEPTVIALNSRTQDVLAMGQEAWQMIGRTPGYIVAVRPLRGGAITDFEITQRMIRLLFQRAGVNRLYRARVLICVPSAITHVEQRAVLEAARRAGAAQTYLIEQPMAAAIGAGLPIHEPMGNMVVDVGGGTTEVAVISLGGVVALEALRVGFVRHRRRDPDLRAARVRHRDRRAHRRGDQARDRICQRGRSTTTSRPRCAAATSCRACRRRSCSCPRRCAARSRSRSARSATP